MSQMTDFYDNNGNIIVSINGTNMICENYMECITDELSSIDDTWNGYNYINNNPNAYPFVFQGIENRDNINYFVCKVQASRGPISLDLELTQL